MRTYQNVPILRDLPRRRLQPGVQKSTTVFASVLHDASKLELALALFCRVARLLLLWPQNLALH